jgi:hypothetical protein
MLVLRGIALWSNRQTGNCQWCAAENCLKTNLTPSAPFHRTNLTLLLLICSLGFLSSLSCLTFQNVRQSVQHSLYQGETTMAQRHQRGWLKKEKLAQGETWVLFFRTT